VQRIAFQLRIKAGKIEEYDEAHRHVWPELLTELESLAARGAMGLILAWLCL
jgi:L-rhamnose mutarotase